MDSISIIPTTADLCDDRGDDIQVADPVLISYGGLTAFAGTVETVKVSKDNSLVREMLSEPGEGRVLVVDGDAIKCALVGDQLAGIAIDNEWAGIAVNGYVRDIEALSDLPIGIVALGEYPQRSFETVAGERSVEVTFAGVTFAPGSWLCADADGVVLTQEIVPLG